MEAKEIIFSVVIPTYNRADQLKDCLDSLLKQTFKHFEVLVCDDGSTDNTAEVVRSFQQQGLNIRYFFNENWGGPAYPRNVGIANAGAPWVCFLDSDDIWYPQKLEKCRPYIERYDLICHDFDIMGKNGPRNKIRTYNFREHVFENLMTRGCSIVTSSVCARKDILQEAGGFAEDKTLIAVEDFDLWLRLARKGYAFKVINESLGAYWTGGGNITAASNKQIDRINAVYGKHLDFLKHNRKAAGQAIASQHYLTGWVKHRMAAYKIAKHDYRIAIASGKLAVKVKALYHYLNVIMRLK